MNAISTQIQVLSAYLATIEKGRYVPATSIDQSLVTTQTAIDALIAVGQEKDQTKPPANEVTKGKTKDGKLPNTGESRMVWMTVLGLSLLSFGAVLVVKQLRRSRR